jgi:hypothetical protein
MWIWLGFHKKKNTLYSKSNNNGRAFNIKFQGVALLYIMDRNIEDKKVVCGVYNENELVLSY